MNLQRIETFEELLGFLPKLNRLYTELDGKWDQELSNEDFISELTNTFRPQNHFFGVMEGGRIVYFIALLTAREERAYFWLFYMNKDYRSKTHDVLVQLRSYIKSLGLKQVEFASTRLTSSYKRWVEKWGAKPTAIIYTLSV